MQAAEDLVLCALVRSAITAGSATGTAQAHTTLPAPQALTGVITPLQPGGREPPRPQAPQVAQVATVPTVPTAQPAPSAGSAGGSAASSSAAALAGNVSTSAGLVAANGGSLAALLAQPLPMDAQSGAEAMLPASAAATGITAASQPLSTSAVAPHSVLQPVAAAPAASASAAAVATHRPSPLAALAAPRDQQQQTQPRSVADPAPQAPLAVGGMQATPVPGLHSSSSAWPAAPAVVLPYSSAQQTSASAGHSLPPPGSSVQSSANSGQAFQGVGQQAGVLTAVRPVGPGLQGATALGRAASGQQKAIVGDDIWRLASNVLAAGGTATTVAAVTTAAQQVRHSYAGKACQCLWCNRSEAAQR